MYQDTEQLIHGVSVSPADFYDNGIVILPYILISEITNYCLGVVDYECWSLK